MTVIISVMAFSFGFIYQNNPERKIVTMPISIPKKLNGNLLKLIACFTMLIDHATAGIMLPMIRDGLYAGGLTNHELNLIYKILRGIGRTAFPIFCFDCRSCRS